MDFARITELLFRGPRNGFIGEVDPTGAAALAAAGVIAANGFEIDPLARLRESRDNPYNVVPTVRWSDPTEFLLDSNPGINELAEWWLRIVGPPNPFPVVRVLLSGEAAARELPVEAAGVLIRAPRIVSVACRFVQGEVSNTAPQWTWPLRLAVGARWRSVPSRLDRDAPSWWSRLVIPVPSAGPWASSSLAILDAEEVWAQVGAPGSLRAAAVVVVSEQVTDFTSADLRMIRRNFSADFVAVVPEAEIDRYRGPDEYLIGLITRISHDVPLDAALHDFDPVRYRPDEPTRRFDGPIVYARSGRLDDLQLRATAGRFARAARESDDPRRRGRAYELSDVSQFGAFSAEGGDASDVADLMREEREAQRRAVDRFLTAELEQRARPFYVSRVLPNSEYVLTVQIAARTRLRTIYDQVFPTANLFAEEGPGGIELTVIVTSRTAAAGDQNAGQRDVLGLTRTGDSTPARFPISTGPAGSVIDLRVAVLHRNRIVQTGLFQVEVGSGTPPTFTVEAAVRDAEMDLDCGTAHQAALILNHSALDIPTTTVITEAGVETLTAESLEGVVGEISAVLDRLVNDPDMFEGNGTDEAGYRNKAFESLLIRLARKGWGLHEALFGRLRVVSAEVEAELKAARRISILSVKPSAACPLELLYDRRIADGFGGPEVRLCQEAPLHVADGECPGSCDGADTGAVVCPFGFWGIRKIIERHVGGEHLTTSGRYKLAVGPDVERHHLRLGGGLAAAADRANDNDATAWTAAAARLGATFELAQSWGELAGKAQSLRARGTPADILMLVTHTNKLAEGVELEIGDGDSRALDLSWDPLVLHDPELYGGNIRGRSNPLVMVLGCSTAGRGSEIYGAPTRFLSEGAPAVVASITTVLGRHIVPVGIRLLEELRTLAASGGPGSLLGEAMLTARRACLLDGNAAVLALVSFGDTDWQLSVSEDV